MSTDHELWLKLTKEDPIDPELPICDPHHHLWDRTNNRYLPGELFQDIGGGHNIVSTIFVESQSVKRKEERDPLGETKFVHDITDQKLGERYGKTKVAAGIVGFADLTLGSAVASILEGHIATSDRFRGIRYITAYDDNQRSMGTPALLLDPEFRKGFTCLRDYGLSFDAWLFYRQLMELVDLAKSFPDIPIILEHIGGPINVGSHSENHEEVYRDWKKGIAELAVCSNVYVKIGGLGMRLYGFGWDERSIPPDSVELAESMAPYYLWCIEKFGVDRCMFESNFPVDKTSYSYTVLWNAFKRITKGFSHREKTALFNGTASRVYRV